MLQFAMSLRLRCLATLAVVGACACARGEEVSGAREFHTQIEPILQTYCFDCHADGVNKGKVAFDEFKTDQAAVADRDLWEKALKYLRAGLMPPAKKPRPTAEQRGEITQWIKTSVFQSDPLNPDPGRVTLRRLNRAEYKNTIHDLLGVDYDTEEEFPPDDTGYGFDTIGEVLTTSPMLLEKYLTAAQKIVGEAVPVVPRVAAEKALHGWEFHGGGANGSSLSYYTAAAVSNTFTARASGQYQLAVDLMVNEKYVEDVFDYNKCRVTFKVDGRELLGKDYSWEGGKPYHYELNLDWPAGEHQLAFELQPLTPGLAPARTLSIQVTSVTVRGPMAKTYWVRARNYDRYFPKPIPPDSRGQLLYARELLGGFARKAFRRPVDARTVNRLADLAETIYSQPGKTFEEGVAEGMVAVLASPRFLFLDETAEAAPGKGAYPYIDQYSLASRLSYFLWSSMPDEQLLGLAAEGTLRDDLPGQIQRMLNDPRARNFVSDFTGQWLRARDIEDIEIEAREVLNRERKPEAEAEAKRKRFHELNGKPADSLSKDEKAELATLRDSVVKSFKKSSRVALTYDVRHAMREETEDVFDYVLRKDRSLLELLASDYTFLNEPLARQYGISNVVGREMRLVTLPAASPRGGVLTEGTVLVATSNPTRTSPVKRGLFILDSILGTPPPPPPPNIPPLEDAAKGLGKETPSLRETLAAHRKNPLCSSCHNRMDPLGLALENFNALGMWRNAELGETIDASGTLITGEPFKNVLDLKRILVQNHAEDFYRTLTEKMLTYALGRGLEYYDVETVDEIVGRIEKADGRASALLAGVIESAPFERCRKPATSMSADATSSETVNTFNNP
jgi:hypothetical protein